MQKEYAFVDEMEALRPLVEGPGNLERYDYWLDKFRYLRSIAEVRCVWARFNAAMAKVKAEKNPRRAKRLARELALPIRKELVAAFAELHRHLLATVSNDRRDGQRLQLAAADDAGPAHRPRPGVGQAARADVAGRRDALEAICRPAAASSCRGSHGHRCRRDLEADGRRAGAEAGVAEAPLAAAGQGKFASVPLEHVARGVYTVTLPAAAAKDDFEYYIQVAVGGQTIQFPPAGAVMPQTVVVE